MLDRRITIYILILCIISVSAVQLVWALMFNSHFMSLNTAMRQELLKNGIEMTDRLAGMYFAQTGQHELTYRDQGVFIFRIDSGGAFLEAVPGPPAESIPFELLSLHSRQNLDLWRSEWRLKGRKRFVLDNYMSYLKSDSISILPVRAHYLLQPDDNSFLVFGKVMYSVLGRSGAFKAQTRELSLKYLRRGIFLTLIGFVIVAALSRHYLRRNIYKPVQKIISGINELKQGNYNTHIKVSGMKEFVMIADEINALSKGTKILIHEVHHRVKNNLQVIASMMSLQKYQVDDPSLESILQVSIDRIHAMSLIHEYLYKSEGMESISAGDYISSIIKALTYKSGAFRVRADIETAPEIEIPIDILIPVGLILNELVLNSYKHAFIPGAKNTIHCSLSEQDRYLHLEYRDEGTVEPERQVKENASMGMEIIQALSEQLGGTPEISYEPAFSYRLRCPNPSAR